MNPMYRRNQFVIKMMVSKCKFRYLQAKKLNLPDKMEHYKKEGKYYYDLMNSEEFKNLPYF